MDGSFGRFFCGGADFVWSVIRPSGVPSALVIGKAAQGALKVRVRKEVRI